MFGGGRRSVLWYATPVTSMKLGPDPARDTPTSAPASILSSPCWIPAGLSSVHVSRAGLSNVSHNFSSMSIVEVHSHRSAGRAERLRHLAAPFANGFRWSTRYP